MFNKFYKQIDVVAMGSTLSPALANIFMSSLKMMVVYLFQTSLFFLKKENLSLMFIERRPSVEFILISIVSYLKPVKPV